MHPKYELLRWGDEASFHYINCNDNALIKRWHYHEEFELHYFLEFSGESYVGDYVGPVQPKTLFLIAPKLPHSWIRKANADTGQESPPSDFLILFSEVMISNAYQIFPELSQLEGMLEDAKFGIEFVNCPNVIEVGKLMMELNNKTEGCAKLVQFFSILDKLMQCDYKKLASSRLIHRKDNTASEALNKALDYINNHFHEGISLESVSEFANMSPSYFSRVFKKCFDIGFLDYVNKLRVEKACLLLTKTDKAISSIGYECGFCNISNFNRNFKKYLNKAPSEFRVADKTPMIAMHD
ncbi:MAG: AraC family transcriptional regulator [Marinobacter sp.]|uniref:AraC family transcriptional regulator n=1 Tax=Marinobacter sp. TaxID=50741 RepID=UPI0034A0AC73